MKGEFKFVAQRTDFDCVCASLAMFAQISYEESFDVCKQHGWQPEKKEGISNYVLIPAMKSLGFHPIELFHAYPREKRIVTVPSLNHPGRCHAIFATGDYYYDPQEGRRAKAYSIEAGKCPPGITSAVYCLSDGDVYEEACYEMSIYKDALEKYKRESNED